ncbi:MAG: MerR family transcriptional regulator [Alphaproteobacteria bacterium]
MNTTTLNKVSNNYDSDEGFAPTQRITSQASIDMPAKKVKKAQGAFRTISEVADKLDVQQHVLRFWETKFSQVRPLKRGGGRRYYRPEDVALLERIHHLLYTEGYTIKGVQKLLKGQGKQQIIAEANNENATAVAPSPKVPAPEAASASAAPQKQGMSAQHRAALEIMLAELKAMRSLIKV